MKHIKPGRGPSAMGALGSVIAVVFGIFWTVSAASMGAPISFSIFGSCGSIRSAGLQVIGVASPITFFCTSGLKGFTVCPNSPDNSFLDSLVTIL